METDRAVPAPGDGKQARSAPQRTMLTRSMARPLNPKNSDGVQKRSKSFNQPPTPTQSHVPNLPVQCASYALEMMSNGGLRRCVIGASVTDEYITLQYYDHSIIIYSEPLNFVTDSFR